MPGEQVYLVALPVGMMRHGIGVVCDSPPKISHKPVGVVNGLDAPALRRT